MAELGGSGVPPRATSQGTFARKATGLVREVSPFSTFVFNMAAQPTAILITGLAFGLGHGLVLGLPVLAFFGITLAWLRWQTGSVYPGMIVHGTFNGLALLAVVFR